MSHVAYTPLNAPKTVAKPGRVLICENGECKLGLKLGRYFDGTHHNRDDDRPLRWQGNVARLRGWALAALFVLPLAACGPRERTPGPNDTFGSSVTAMDHDPSDTFVRNVYVDGTWVGEASMGGGVVAGGISLPHQWRPGLTAVVKWERCEPYGKNCRWTEKVVPIHRYGNEVGRTWLHILEGEKVLIIPSMLGPGHPDYPGPDLPTKDFFRNTDKDVKP